MMPIIIGTISSSFPAGVTPPVAPSRVAYRYWRLKFQDGDSASFCSLAEVEFRAVAAGPSIATGGTAFGSADRGGSWVKSNAFDGNDNTFFSSTVDYPVYLGYDFTTDVIVKEVMIKARPTFDEHTPTVFVLEASHDNLYYVPQAHGSVTSDWTAAQEVIFDVDTAVFDSTNHRVGFQHSDAVHSFAGQDFYPILPISMDGFYLRTTSSGKNWTGGVFRTTSTGRIISKVHDFTADMPSSSNFLVTVDPPISFEPNERFMIGVYDDVDQEVRLNDITSIPAFGLVEPASVGWDRISSTLPEIGDERDNTPIGQTAFLVSPKGSFERDIKDVPDMTGKTLVLLIMGQSNSIGRGSDLLAIDTTTVADVHMVNAAGSIVLASEPVSHDGQENAGDGGYNFATAREMKTEFSPDRVVIVGCGQGGSGFVGGEWNQSNGSRYNPSKARWNAAIATINSTYGAENVIPVIIWTQGEDECYNYTSLFDDADDLGRHRGAVQHFLTTVRAEWDFLSDAAIITTPIPSTAFYQSQASYTNIQNDLSGVRDTLGKCGHLSMSGITETFEDTLHWDVATMREFGPNMCDALRSAYRNDNFPDTTAMVSIPDASRVSVPISLDARGLADDAVLLNHGIHKEFDNKRVKIKNGAMSFDGDSELRWRDNGKPIIGANDFVIKMGFLSTSISSLQGLFADYNTSGNKRSWLLRLSGSALQFYGSTTGTSPDLLLEKTGLSSNTLYEVEIRRVGTSMELFVDGVSEDTYTGAYTFFDTGLTESVYLGEYNNNTELLGDITHVSLEFL